MQGGFFKVTFPSYSVTFVSFVQPHSEKTVLLTTEFHYNRADPRGLPPTPLRAFRALLPLPQRVIPLCWQRSPRDPEERGPGEDGRQKIPPQDIPKAFSASSPYPLLPPPPPPLPTHPPPNANWSVASNVDCRPAVGGGLNLNTLSPSRLRLFA